MGGGGRVGVNGPAHNVLSTIKTLLKGIPNACVTVRWTLLSTKNSMYEYTQGMCLSKTCWNSDNSWMDLQITVAFNNPIPLVAES